MVYIVAAIVLGLITIAAVISWKLAPARSTSQNAGGQQSPSSPMRKTFGLTALTAAVLLVLLTAGLSMARVGAREVGIETSLGKYSRTLQAGWQLKAPWAEVETFSTRLQRSELDAPIAFAGGGSGTQHMTVQWTITGEQAQELWSRYQRFDNVDGMLVQPAAKEAVGAVLASYTPAEARAEGKVEEIRQAVEQALAQRLGTYGVQLDSVALPPAALDQTAQDALNRVVEANANVDRAQSRLEQAKIDAEADRERNRNVTTENLILECLTVTNNWNAEKNGPLPATWNCFGALDAGVVVNPNR
ncbi:SPFH domain-containing protein [Kocuria flava]|uniref:SPFH domain-containing protein n=1 Tax=Kocuria flava TaxID=446860 RepID=UPI002F94BB08